MKQKWQWKTNKNKLLAGAGSGNLSADCWPGKLHVMQAITHNNIILEGLSLHQSNRRQLKN